MDFSGFSTEELPASFPSLWLASGSYRLHTLYPSVKSDFSKFQTLGREPPFFVQWFVGWRIVGHRPKQAGKPRRWFPFSAM